MEADDTLGYKVVPGVWAAFKYAEDQRVTERHDAETRRIEARKPFLEKQLALYFEAAQVSGKLITITPAIDEWSGIERRFWELYWSELAMVEDHDVESAMADFGKMLTQYEEAYKKHDAESSDKYNEALKGASLNLSHAIRNSITAEWSGSVSGQ